MSHLSRFVLGRLTFAAFALLLAFPACSSDGGGSGESNPGQNPGPPDSPGPSDSSCTSERYLSVNRRCVLTVALWSAGEEDGDFGFRRCQELLDGTASPTTSGQRIAQDLKRQGFTKAVFFGSTPDYNFTGAGDDEGIDKDPQALGAMGTTGDVTNLNVRTVRVIRDDISYHPPEVGSGTLVDSGYTLGNLLNVDANGGWPDRRSQNIIADAVGNREGEFWSFTDNQSYHSMRNCAGAMSMATSDFGSTGKFNNSTDNNNAIDGNKVDMGTTPAIRCDLTSHVLCIAR